MLSMLSDVSNTRKVMKEIYDIKTELLTSLKSFNDKKNNATPETVFCFLFKIFLN